MKIALSVVVLFLLAACSSVNTPASSSSEFVWPPAPEPARIAFVRSLSRPADFGAKSSPLTRFGRWLTGSSTSADALRKPFGLAFDEEENLCLTDTGDNSVCFYDRTARKWHAWRKVGSVQFVSPVAVAKRNGTFFVADSSLGKVVAFHEDGKLQFEITNHLQRPCAVAITAERLYVADSQRHCVCLFSIAGEFQKEFGARGAGPGQFNFPTHLALDQAGQVYVTDSMNSRVQIFSAEGVYRGEIGKLGDSPGHFGRPKGSAVDNEGRVYVMDAAFDNLQIFDRRGQLLLAVGQTGLQPGQFWLANGIAINHSNEIYVADSYNRRVQMFKYIGQ